MKRITGLLVLSVFFLSLTYGKQIDEVTAKTVGKNFIAKQVSSPTLKNGSDLELVYTVKSSGALRPGYTSDETCLYVFTVNSSQGFIIVSGEDNVVPVLAYSYESGFNVNNIAPDVAYWLNGYKEQIEEVRAKNMQATDEIRAQWEALKTGTGYNPI